MKKYLTIALLIFPNILQAEVIKATEYGFKIKLEQTVNVDVIKAYQQFLRVGQWWNSEHTWFGKAENLSIEAKAGGCFCEKSGEKEVLHMTVSYIEPNKEIRFIGGLGPLQMLGVNGGMSWEFVKMDENNTKIIQQYQVVGFMDGGLAQLAPIVDKVQGLQLTALITRLEKGE